MSGPPLLPPHATPRSARRRLPRALRALAALTAAGVLGLGVLGVALWFEHRAPLTLPVPTGPYVVGRAVVDWRDAGGRNAQGRDANAPGAGAPRPAPRELLVWFWYPALSPPGAVAADYAPYLPAPMPAAVARARGALIAGFLTRDLARVRGHSLLDAPVSPTRPAYPVVVLRGGASAEVWTYASLAEDLASYGYVVVGFDAPGRTNVVAFPDGRVVRRAPENDPELAAGAPDSAQRMTRILHAWATDVGAVLDGLGRLGRANAAGASSAGDDRALGRVAGRLAGRLDLARVGVVGHSLGGAVALQFCHDDPRCAAAVDIDGAPLGSAVRDGVPRPVLFVLGGHGDAADPEVRRVTADIRSIYDRLPPDGRGLVTIPGANHFLFSDDGALLKSQLLQRALRAAGALGLDGRRQLALTADCVRRFLDTHVAGVRHVAVCATP